MNPAADGKLRGRRYFKRFTAVFAGFLVIVVVTTLVDLILHAVGVFPPFGQMMSDPLFVLALCYRIVISIWGCYLAARLAPDYPARHAMALGIVGLFVSTAGAIAMWNAGPPWYSLAVIAISIPCAWAGGRLFERRR